MNLRNILSDDQVIKGIKRKSLLFLDSASEVLLLLCIYFFLVLNALKESFEQTRFARDTISLYKKVLSNPSKILSAFKK